MKGTDPIKVIGSKNPFEFFNNLSFIHMFGVKL